MNRSPSGSGRSRRRGDERGRGDSSTSLHEERLDAVATVLLEIGAESVLDLGCGSGALLERLLPHAQFGRILGIETSLEALARAERLRPPGDAAAARLSLRHGSFMAADEGMTGYDAAAMVESIEHVDPAQLSRLERAVFGQMRPGVVVLTTPNREYNEVYGLRAGEVRHADHRFEWDRSRFQRWATGVAERNDYGVEFQPVGPTSGWLGAPTQMAIFRRRDWAPEPGR